MKKYIKPILIDNYLIALEDVVLTSSRTMYKKEYPHVMTNDSSSNLEKEIDDCIFVDAIDDN